MVSPRVNRQAQVDADIGPVVDRSATGGATMTVRVPVTFKRRGGRKALVSPDGAFPAPTPGSGSRNYSPAVKALARAFRWRKLIETGVHSTIADVARAEGINPSYVSRVLRLTLLAPDIIEGLFGAKSAPETKSEESIGIPSSTNWTDQLRAAL